MGAFGELLIMYWGGDLDAYRGNAKAKFPKAKTPDVPLTEEELMRRKEDTIKRWRLSHARQTLNGLTDNIMYKFIDPNDINEDSFRNAYRNENTDEWIIDIMWKEYNEFLTKYVKP